MSIEIRQYTVIDPSLKDAPDAIEHHLYIMCSDNQVVSLMDLERYGVKVRLSTDQEVKYIMDMDADLDMDEPDNTMSWPEHEAEIRLTVKDW